MSSTAPVFVIEDLHVSVEGNDILKGVNLTIRRHGARFDVTSGRVLALSAVRPLRTYPVRAENGEIGVPID